MDNNIRLSRLGREVFSFSVSDRGASIYQTMDGEDSQGDSTTAVSVWEPDSHDNLCFCLTIESCTARLRVILLVNRMLDFTHRSTALCKLVISTANTN